MYVAKGWGRFLMLYLYRNGLNKIMMEEKKDHSLFEWLFGVFYYFIIIIKCHREIFSIQIIQSNSMHANAFKCEMIEYYTKISRYTRL